jgi:hypothetical protein
MKVWTVWEGSYSSRELLGVFSTPEKAEEYRKKRLIAEYSEIDEINNESIEYEIDVGSQNVETFRVVLQDGQEPDIWHVQGCEEDVFINEHGTAFVIVNYNPDRRVMIKVARDRLAAYRAKELGI